MQWAGRRRQPSWPQRVGDARSGILPADHEHADERGDVIVLAPRGADLAWISRSSPTTTFSVPPIRLWLFVTGMIWRTYDHDGLPLSRLNTAAYKTTVTAFRRAIQNT